MVRQTRRLINRKYKVIYLENTVAHVNRRQLAKTLMAC
jgi:hypothetical protein